MKRLVLTAVLFLVSSVALAADLKLPSNVSGDVGDFVTVKADTTGTVVKWYSMDASLKLFPTDLLKDTKTAVCIGKAAGTYKLLAYTADKDGPSDPAICLVTVGSVPPGPGPVPPGPGPIPPLPPDPFANHPFGTAAGLHVLIVYDTSALGTMPRGQLEALTDGNVRTYLNSHCFAGPDGKTKEWRLWDNSVVTDAETPLWQKVMKRPRVSLPWIVIGNGITGYEGPLPADASTTLGLLNKFGGV